MTENTLSVAFDLYSHWPTVKICFHEDEEQSCKMNDKVMTSLAFPKDPFTTVPSL